MLRGFTFPQHSYVGLNSNECMSITLRLLSILYRDHRGTALSD